MKMESVILQAALLLGFGYTTFISANFEITTTGNSGEGFSQGSEAILACTINPYTGSQTWKVDNVSVADCGFVLCSENTSNPERYSFMPNVSTGNFLFTINPVEYADDGNIDCFDGSNTETFTMVVTDPSTTSTTETAQS
ncbi:uncharacterized protein LOC128552694 [Mercenaria mercenaria]|uniref:uncharacterized protein LOC128552694 n=1 Tax=Mercenaria mercenaria TaxID=6596 RepID=UPI00234FA85F|nr:uncharacterized protein LOC128552694 [Mercenaria mercenaria]XP_053389715.1 uncharacterized protein LOC128552694 [Mercenaria mercenaria]